MSIDSQEITAKIIDLFYHEVVPAKGCTEPIAIAYAAAKARQILEGFPQKLNVFISGNIIKNVKSVIIPNSGGLVGIEVSAAMGALFGDPSKGLMVISQISPDNMLTIKDYLAKNSINVMQYNSDLKLYIKVEAISDFESASVELMHSHTNITEITKNGKVLFKAQNKSNRTIEEDFAETLSVRLIYDIAKEIDLSLISPCLDKVIKCNQAIAKEGLNGNFGANVGKNIKLSIEKGFYGNDVRNLSASFAAAASDARMGGSSMAVMTSAGSGNVGIAASLPIITYCQNHNISRELLYRALFFSIMCTVHIKACIGRLSAYCGPMCASGAVAGALGFINDTDFNTIENAIINTLAGVSGVVCDGANSSCAVKIANGTYAAYDGIAMAMNGNRVASGDGIVADDLETTIKNIGELAKLGMQKADEIVLKIMTRKK